MKVAYINTVYGVKSTGRTYYELKQILEGEGHQCKVFYGVGCSDEENTYRIGSNITYYIHNFLSRVVGLEGYFSLFATRKLVKQLIDFNPDIIHLGCLHGHYLHLPTLFNYLKKSQKAVFITSHDCWFFTGKCTHFTSQNCDKFKTGCNNCPAKKRYPKSLLFDFSKKMYTDKKKWFEAIENLNVICVSNWMKQHVSESFFKEKKIFVNYNWINTDLFLPISSIERQEIRTKNEINSDDFLIIAVSSFWRKGTPRYDDLLKLMGELKDNQKLLVVGMVQDEFPENSRVKFIPFVSDVSYLAKLYGCADLFVHFSMEDTFGKVIAEAQACGTPSVVYDTTACPEIARIGDGFVVAPRDIDAVLDVIDKMSDTVSKEETRLDRAGKVKAKLSKDVCAKSLTELYKNSLK